MKRERRHELQHNVLADWLARVIAVVKPYSTAILALLLLGILALGVYAWQAKVSAANSAKAWDDFHLAFTSGEPSDLDDVAEKYPGTDVAHWAAVVAADVYLNEGCQQLFSNKANASQELRKAVEHYKQVLQESRVSALRERATFGLARAYEALAGTRQSEGELDKAVQQYQEVVKSWPNGAYAAVAAGRIEDIERRDIKAFYDEFATWEPEPAYFPPMPTPDGRPPLDFDSLGEGSVSDFSRELDLDDEEEEQPQPADNPPSPTEPGETEETPSETPP